MKCPIGATSYVFRYLLAGDSNVPTLTELLELAADFGLERFQICENARPLDASCSEWSELKNRADGLGLRISLGCMTLDPHIVDRYLDRVEAIGGSMLRIVLERDGPSRLNHDQIRGFLDQLAPRLERRRIRLAIENHFEIPAKLLAACASAYPPSVIGFCIDVANSLRNFEDTDRVFDVLGDRAICFHLKDYRVDGSNVGFSVTGAAFGQGQIDVPRMLRRVSELSPSPELYLETWTPSTGNRDADVATDAEWLRQSVANLRAALADLG
jgi:sugar phosphate isomerase/epimerase